MIPSDDLNMEIKFEEINKIANSHDLMIVDELEKYKEKIALDKEIIREYEVTNIDKLNKFKEKLFQEINKYIL